ncbi:hypothetical protein GCM10029992_16620 [Glycomyces albus]
MDTVQLLDKQYNNVEANLDVPESATDGSITELEVVFSPPTTKRSTSTPQGALSTATTTGMSRTARAMAS